MIKITGETDYYYCRIKLFYATVTLTDIADLNYTCLTPYTRMTIYLFLRNLGCIHLVNGEIGYMVYIWRFPCLDYPLDVLILWIRKLNSHNWFWPLIHLIHYSMSTTEFIKLVLPTFIYNTFSWWFITCLDEYAHNTGSHTLQTYFLI